MSPIRCLLEDREEGVEGYAKRERELHLAQEKCAQVGRFCIRRA